MERIDQLSTPPIIGKFYLVPASLWDFGLRGRPKKWWPVIGPKHDDVEFFNFRNKHYHIDPRFLTQRHWPDLRPPFWCPDRTALDEALASPLNSIELEDGPDAPHWRKMKCTMNVVPYGFGDTTPVQAIREHFAGQQCARGKYGWICPHRNVQLGSLTPIDGVIVCPLHGMKIDAATGVVLR